MGPTNLRKIEKETPETIWEFLKSEHKPVYNIVYGEILHIVFSYFEIYPTAKGILTLRTFVPSTSGTRNFNYNDLFLC